MPPQTEIAVIEEGAAGLAGSTHHVGWQAEVRTNLLDETRSVLKAMLGNAAVLSGDGKALGLKVGLQKIDELWMGMIPVLEAAQGALAPNAIWMPAVMLSDFGQITRNVKTQKNTNPRQTVFKPVARLKDSTDAVMPDWGKFLVIGPPSSFAPTAGTDWANLTIPDLTTYLP